MGISMVYLLEEAEGFIFRKLGRDLGGGFVVKYLLFRLPKVEVTLLPGFVCSPDWEAHFR